MMRTRILGLLTLGFLCAPGCEGSDPKPAPRGLALSVAPLSLPGLGLACYDVAVTTATGTVWSAGAPALTRLGHDQTAAPDATLAAVTTPGAFDAATLCSDQYGHASGGDLTYIAPCDASPEADTDAAAGVQNLVTLWVDGLYDAGGTAELGAWQDPCPSGCSLDFDCLENQDTLVELNLTIMRSAQQGFFDVAVDFQDIFCSAKLDTCYPDDRHLELLFGADLARDWTAVFGFACTAGAGAAETLLHYGALAIDCGGVVFPLDPTLPAGNQSTTVAGHTLHYGLYRGTEQLDCDDTTTAGLTESCNKLYWNLALSLDDLAAVGGTCTLGFSATATDGATTLTNGLPTAAGLAYPYIDVDADLTTNGLASCQRHALNDGGAVATAYHGDLEGLATALPMCSAFDGFAAGPVPGATCTTTLTEFCGGSGTSADPYLICTIAHLAELDAKLTDPTTYSVYASASYRQVNNLDFGGQPRAFLPIGTHDLPLATRHEFPPLMSAIPSTRPFLGTYDGAGKHLANLAFLSTEAADYQGLFTMLGAGSVLKNLVFDAPSFDLADTVAAGVVAGHSSGRIDNIIINGLDATLGHVTFFGGLVGVLNGGVGATNIQVTGAILGSPDVSPANDAFGLGMATTNRVAGLAGMAFNFDAGVTTTLEGLDVNVAIDVGGAVAGVATYIFGQVALRDAENRGLLHSRMEVAGLVDFVVSGSYLGVPGLTAPILDGLINWAEVRVSGAVANQTRAAGVVTSVSGATVTEIHNRGDVTNDHLVAGGASGLVMYFGPGTLARASSTGDITNRANQVNAAGDPVTFSDVAGLIGLIAQDVQVSVSDCYSTGHLSAGTDQNDIGGLVADLWDLSDASVIDLRSCYSANTFSGGFGGRGAALGNIVVRDGHTPSITVADLYWNTATGSATITTGIGGDTSDFDPSEVVGLTTAEMQSAASFVGFDFTNVWLPPSGGGFPLLR